MKYPEYVRKILNRIEEAGHEAFIVGGALRDMMIGRESHDYDITTSALPEETAEIFSDMHVIKTGLKHGTVTVVIDRHPIEITTYRVDGDYKDSRHPSGVRFTRNIEDDLARRDFTVNAMAYNDKRGLVDLFGGKDDLERRIIRAVGEPERRFTEDALRIMRAFRFSSKLGFEIEEETLAAAEKCRHGLANISAERKSVELEGILLGEGVEKALLCMYNAKIFEIISPMIYLDTTRFSKVNTLPNDFACRMAFCLSNQENAEKYTTTLKLSNAVSARIKKLARFAEAPLDASSDGKLRRLMSVCGDDIKHLLKIKSALGEDVSGIPERVEAIKARGDCLYIRQLAVDGRDLGEMGISGKDVGNTLDKLLDAVLDNPELNTKDSLMAMIKD